MRRRNENKKRRSEDETLSEAETTREEGKADILIAELSPRFYLSHHWKL